MPFYKQYKQLPLLALLALSQLNYACWAKSPISAFNIIPAPPAAITDSKDSEATLKGTIENVDPASAVNQVDELTKQILLKEIEIERFNIHYSMEVAKQGRWKGWRYAGFQEVNAGMGLAGAIIGTANRGSHLRTPLRVWVQVQESACYIPMIGSIIGASAAALEFAINEYHDIQATQKGFSPHLARSYVLGKVEEIDNLMDKRDVLIKVEAQLPINAGHVQIDTVEGKILEDIRSQAILEFARFHIRARKVLAFQQAQYFFDLSKYTLNAIGYEFAYLSLHRHRRIWNFRAGVMWDIAGPIYMGAPIVSRLIGKGVGEMNKHFLRPLTKDIENDTIETLQTDCCYLDNLCKTGAVAPPSASAATIRQEIYNVQNRAFQEEIRGQLKEIAKSKLTATQNIGAGMFVGSLKLAQGIVFTIPGYYHDYNSKTRRAARVTNTNLFVGSVVSLPAGAFAMADTLRIQIRGEINRHKLLKAGLHPTQVAAARLKELDAIEAKLKSGT